jgi:hypothetical protein
MKQALRIVWIWLLLVMASVASPRSNAQVLHHVSVTQLGTDFVYTLFNDEPTDSTNFLSLFEITVDAPISVIATPEGWGFDTDEETFVTFFNMDAELPYPHDVAPGASLSGFIIRSLATETTEGPYSVLAWDHASDAPGPTDGGLTTVPFSPAVVADAPEPGSLALFGIGAIGLTLTLRRKTGNTPRRRR